MERFCIAHTERCKAQLHRQKKERLRGAQERPRESEQQRRLIIIFLFLLHHY
jgi:hypothetical protein